MIKLHRGDCLDVLATLDPGSITAIVTDPPYGLKFMGKAWDHGVPGVPYWSAALRVLRPGGYLLSFGGTRTHHRLTCSIEDAGFEIRDCLMWLYGSGFPKGKGCLKPAWEPIVLACKPGPKVLPLGIEECRVGTGERPLITKTGHLAKRDTDCFGARRAGTKAANGSRCDGTTNEGRWPPNLLLSHHELCNGTCHADCVVRTLGEQSGESKSPSTYLRSIPTRTCHFSGPMIKEGVAENFADTGTAARFYPQFRYCPKASRRDRNEGCEGMEAKEVQSHRNITGDGSTFVAPDGTVHSRGKSGPSPNHHATVKPTDLMEWLVRLACPEGGTVLDPFMGSGSTGKACVRAGRSFIGIELDPQWIPIARRRIAAERRKHSPPAKRLTTDHRPLTTIHHSPPAPSGFTPRKKPVGGP